MKIQEDKNIIEEYKKHLIGRITNLLEIKLILGILILPVFIYIDVAITHCVESAYTRIVPLSIAFLLLILKLATKKHNHIIVNIYIILLVSILIMMLAKWIVLLEYTGVATSTTGIILLYFLVSLEIKTDMIKAILVYFIPVLIFIGVITFILPVSIEQHILLVNIYPLVIFGFTVNRIQNNINFKVFKSNYLLEKEKEKTKELYNQTRSMNESLIIEKEKVEESEEKLRESNQTKDKFFSIIAHDLKSPFNAILGFSQLLMKNHKKYDDDKRDELIKYVNISAINTFKLLENLLTWSRSQSDRIEFSPEKVNLKTIIYEITLVLQKTAESKNIKLVDNADIELFANVDRNMLDTILRNLITNAIKFTNTSGTVTVSANETKDPRFIEISVTDTGVGIPKDRIDDLFRIDKNTSTEGTAEEKGTGLGLILCKEFVEKHGGKIRIESEIDKGSSFIFTLPV